MPVRSFTSVVAVGGGGQLGAMAGSTAVTLALLTTSMKHGADPAYNGAPLTQ
jgi:hypothetical protein